VVPAGEQLLCLGFSSKGNWLAAGCLRAGEHSILVWDLAARQARPRALPLPTTDGVAQVVFSPDARALAAACLDGGMVLFDTAEFQQRLHVGGDNPFGVTFSPDSRFLAIPSSQLEVVRLWDLSGNKERAVLSHPGWPHSVVFGPGARVLISDSRASVRVWDMVGAGEKRVLAAAAWAGAR
jgi:WD40 repeat protein